MKIKAIAFDLIGTLVKIEEKEDLALTKLYDALKKFNFKEEFSSFKKVYDEAALKYLEIRKKTGIEVNNKVWIKEALINLGFKKAEDEKVLNKAVEAYFQPYVSSIKVPNEVYKVLSILKKSYKLGVISNFTNPPTVYEILKKKNLLKFFNAIVISGEIGWRKPKKDIFLKFLSLLELSPYESIFVGDDPRYDVKGAKEAGMIAILLAGGETRLSDEYYKAELKEAIKPDYTIESLSELLSLLEALS